MLEYWESFFLGILKTPLIYVQGFILCLLIGEQKKHPHYQISKWAFLGLFCAMSLILYLVLGNFVKWTKEDFSATPYVLFLYLIIFCLVYEAFFFFQKGKDIQGIQNPIYFVLLFVSVTGVFYTTEIFGASLVQSLIFILGECFGVFLFVQIILSLYERFSEKYHGPKLLKNPMMAIFLSSFVGELIVILQFWIR